jgi:hypothetical protein
VTTAAPLLPLVVAAVFSALAATQACGSGGNAGSTSGTTGDGGSVAQDASGSADVGSRGSSGGAGTDAAGGGSSDVAAAGDASGEAAAGSCSPDGLHTGLIAQQTGVSVDSFDCSILKYAAQYAEPDPMIFKAIIYVESRFDENAVACSNLPCGTPSGWTTAESYCYGLMQIVPACVSTLNAPVLLPSGHPDLEKSPMATDWSNSVYDPDANIHVGIAGIADNRAQVMKAFPGCTTDQYTMMAVGNYNSYGSTKSCTVYNTAYDDGVNAAYTQYAMAAGYPAHAY